MDGGSEGAPLAQLVVLALVQGITEFLPISSSGHLILVPAVMEWRDQGLSVDVAMHIGTLIAVTVYFRSSVASLVRGGLTAMRAPLSADSKLALQVVMATLPVVIAGFLLKDRVEHEWRSPMIVCVNTFVFGVFLWIADRRADRADRTLAGLSWRDALLIGVAQAIALLPGVSRSGITMTAALLLGQNRLEAARFSLLLSIPTTAAAGTLGAYDLVLSGDAVIQYDAVVAGVLALLAAYIAIALMMSWLKSATFRPFVYYRLALAAVLAGMLWFNLL